MAKTKNDKSNIRFGSLKKIARLIQNNTDDIYKTTYYSDSDNKKELNSLKASIDSSIKNILDNNADMVGEPNISKLYERMFMNKQNDSSTTKEFERIFNDNEFISELSNSYLDNRWVKEIDDEIDEVLKYMPKLNEALLTIRDNVLSADSFSKDFLTMKSKIEDASNMDLFNSNINELKEKYKLLQFTNELYLDVSKYGECYIYRVPYQKAIQKLVDNKQSMNRNIAVKTNFQEGKVLIESTIDNTSNTINANQYGLNSRDNDFSFSISYNEGVIQSIVSDAKDARDKLIKVHEQSLTEQYLYENVSSDISNAGRSTYKFTNTTDSEIDLNGKLPKHHNFDKTLHDEMEIDVDDDNTSSDGLIDRKQSTNTKINSMNGCIVKKLRRDRITPIMLNDVCLGYYYFEFDESSLYANDKQPGAGLVNTITGLRSNGRAEAFDAMQRRDELLKYLVGELADRIDTKFINDNQDLKKEIYYILKYNDIFYQDADDVKNIKVTYIPPDDIQHFYFELDERTNRGISDLNLSLIPAKLWVAITITNALGIMTRGNDKRVYYVKQSVEANISKTLLKTIDEIKKSNFGIRQLQNINNVLNITGRFNDYIIPRGSDGQSPIEFEIMPGQQIEIKTDLLNILEESAINNTGVPIELIQNRQSPDYATQLTMSNTKFLRYVYTRQSQFQLQLGSFLTTLYDIEYGTNDKIEVTLPPPLFINVTNTDQLIMNTSNYCNSITEIVMANETDDTLKATVSKNLKMYHLGSYLNMPAIEDIVNKSKQEVAKLKVQNPEDNGGDESY